MATMHVDDRQHLAAHDEIEVVVVPWNRTADGIVAGILAVNLSGQRI
jgi:hypothetical protein